MSSVVCLHVPRFALAVAAAGRRELLGVPLALAPQPGGGHRIGEVSPAAEVAGVRAGQQLGEALARCPRLVLLPPDPVAVEARWERIVEQLEGIGAAVEVGSADVTAGTAWLDADLIRRMHGGTLEGVLGAIRATLGQPVRLGVAPTRFLARVAAARARARHAVVVVDRPLSAVPSPAGGALVQGVALRAVLDEEPVATLALREDLAGLVAPLERLGITTLGRLASLSRGAVLERFGAPGLTAHELLHGHEAPLRPREPPIVIAADLRLPEAVSGPQLRHALGLLIDRVLADPQRRHRPLRALRLQAALVERGTWQERVVLRAAMTDPQRIGLALGLRLDGLPAPAERLGLRVEALGAPVPHDRSLLEEDVEIRRERLREAIRQARAAAGPDAALRVVEVDPGSRIGERRMALTPFEG